MSTEMDFSKLISPSGDRVSRMIYSDDEIYRREQKTVFAQSWLFLGHESQIKEPGDFFTTHMGDEPVIVTRGRGRKIHVHLNTCRHRGLRVCRADKGNTTTFSCPYHGWTYSSEGALMGMPQAKRYYPDLDKSAWGLISAAQIDSYLGLIFATFNPKAPTLGDYLGDARFYLDTLLDRRAGGTEVLGIQKWRARTNWKMPTENMVGDVGHAEYSHRSVFDLNPFAEESRAQIASSLNIALQGGHGLTARYFEDGANPADLLPGEKGMVMLNGEIREYFESVQAEAEERLGKIKSRVKPATSAIFPNMHVLTTTFCLRVAHPRGPLESELWNWVIVDAQAPQVVKDQIRSNYLMVFGPEGILEQDDDENWEEVTRGSSGAQASKYPYHMGMGMDQGSPHEDIPGLVGTTASEHTQRGFYLHWLKLLQDEKAGQP